LFKTILHDKLHWLNVHERIEYKHVMVPVSAWGTERLGTSLMTSSQPVMLLLAIFIYDPLTWIVSLLLVPTDVGLFIMLAQQSGTLW